MGDQIGGIFDRKADLIERLHQGPGEEARAISTIGPAGPTPSRWTLRKIRISIPWLRDYSLSGVWRLLRRLQIRLRSGQVQNYSPDPDYVPKVEHLLDVLRQVAQAPKDKVLVFVDEMGYLRWPEPAADWTEQAPAPAAVAERAKSRQQQWRVIGALNAWTAQVDYRDNYIVGREQVKA